MSNVKYNNWQSAVRDHQPEGFDQEAAWQKLRQRRQPEQKRRWWLKLAAACLAGIIFSVVIINKDQHAVKEDIAVRPAYKAPIQQTNRPVQNDDRSITSLQNSTTQQPAIKKKILLPVNHAPQTIVPGNEEPVTIIPRAPENATIVMPLAENNPPATVKTEVAVQKKPAMKVLHINEVNNYDYGQQQITKTDRSLPKIPLLKPSSYNMEEEAPPPSRQKSGGILRSISSLKEN